MSISYLMILQYTSLWIHTLFEKVLYPLSHTQVLPKKVLGSIGLMYSYIYI